MEKVKDLLTEIKTGLSQTSSSQKDEIRVMKAMLNDRDYKVDVYGKNGVESTYCPAEDARSVVASVIASATKISGPEAEVIANNYEFKKSEAASMINISKEFVNTYLQTGRKLPLGGREKSNVALAIKEVDEITRLYPKKTGVNSDGSGRYDKAPAKIKAHQSVRVYGPCPEWVK